ncbi:M56 family metallopeptidase [Emticicia sp. TH156]|uniref:M56 family metallopeptidase n=1 Tax=Emticicia sp. TH156 TaxID=2067454 RepID=UPI000C77C95A|nr:M56 family metallopeptidase [Emticicia sp. TH156]PLK42510.1 hypothetical protein C0V77_19975 [Emticicia sp. TH156]
MKKLFDFTTGIPENISSALGWTLFHSLWQGIVIVVAFGILRQVFKASHARYWQGIGALSLQFISAVVTFFVVYEPAENLVEGKKRFTAFFIQNATTNLDSVSVFGSATRLSLIQQAELFVRTNLDTFVLFWFIGANLLLLRLIVGFVYVQQLKVQSINPVKDEILGMMEDLQAKMQLNIPIRLFESAKAVVPMTIGWIKPIVLLPAGIMSGLTVSQLEAVLAHELAHIKRYDYLVNIFQSFIEILFFYHPATWFISAQVRDERENCCDDYAVNICGDRLALAKALTQVATFQQQPHLAMAFGAKRQTFMDRIKRIVGINDAKPMSYGNWAVFVGLVMIIAVGVAYGQERIATIDKTTRSSARPDKTREEMDFYFFEKDKKDVGVYKNKKGEIVKIIEEGKVLEGQEFDNMKLFAIDFLRSKNANFAIVPGINESEMDAVRQQFFEHGGYTADTTRLQRVENEMELLNKEMEKYNQLREKHWQKIEDKYSKQMEKHSKEMDLISAKMEVPHRKIENISIEMQEVDLAIRKLENQYRSSKMPADAEQKVKALQKKERELENQMRLVEQEMKKVEQEMMSVQQKMEQLNAPMDSMQRLVERYDKPMDSLSHLMEEKGRIIEKLANEEEARFRKEFADFTESLYKAGLIKDKKDYEIRLKGEKLLINMEPQPQAVYDKVWNLVNKNWGSQMRGLKDKDFRIEVKGESINFSTYANGGNINHYFGKALPPVPPKPHLIGRAGVLPPVPPAPLDAPIVPKSPIRRVPQPAAAPKAPPAPREGVVRY